ncbi:hypothetical protein HGRIS_006165 [Hohenbuehelia grisea]|uniref:Secreted protein n=1 Tax=Hohenbuehelia grisea TaxID=104357 RepID=A0ABR3K1S7_9AGAR
MGGAWMRKPHPRLIVCTGVTSLQFLIFSRILFASLADIARRNVRQEQHQQRAQTQLPTADYRLSTKPSLSHFVTQRRNVGHSVMSASQNYKYLARRNLNQTTFPSSSHLLVVGSRVSGIGAPSEGDDQRFPMRLRKPFWTRLGQRVAYPVLNLSSS